MTVDPIGASAHALPSMQCGGRDGVSQALYSSGVVSDMYHLTVRQRELLDDWLPGAEVLRDHSWGFVGTTVLEVAHGGVRLIVKAGGENDHDLVRELRAHRLWLEPWTSQRCAPLLLRADEEAKLLVREFVEGDLVQGGPYEHAPGIYHQAGALLACLHAQFGVEDTQFEVRAKETTLGWLDRPHRIAPETVAQLRILIDSWPTPSLTVVPTHGDWQPRNWLVHGGLVSVIDFGRADLRPPVTDLARLAGQQFRANPELEVAFLDGYGGDPREPDEWRRVELREAVATVVWGYQIGDYFYERQGHRMIAEALAG